MAVTLKDLVNHPYSFAMGVGIANGFLAVGRGKKIDFKTALTLSTILGLGEMALIMYEPESERTYSLQSVGIFSVLGVLTGLLPFVTQDTADTATDTESGPVPLLASNATPSASANSAVSGMNGWSRSRPRRQPAMRRRYG